MIGARRASWRIVSSIEGKEEVSLDPFLAEWGARASFCDVSSKGGLVLGPWVVKIRVVADRGSCCLLG